MSAGTDVLFWRRFQFRVCVPLNKISRYHTTSYSVILHLRWKPVVRVCMWETECASRCVYMCKMSSIRLLSASGNTRRGCTQACCLYTSPDILPQLICLPSHRTFHFPPLLHLCPWMYSHKPVLLCFCHVCCLPEKRLPVVKAETRHIGVGQTCAVRIFFTPTRKMQ